MNGEEVINPYELLNIDPYNPNMKKLKKNFKALTLICHPDKGGSEKSMRTLHNAYKYIKSQFENCQTVKTYEDLENEFYNFCKNQELKVGTIQYGKSTKNFNTAFVKKHNTGISSFNRGYGGLMGKSEYAAGKLTYDNNTINSKISHNFTNVDNDSLTVYKAPESYQQSYGHHERFDIDTVGDFSYSTGGLIMADYEKAFKIIGEENVNSVKLEARDYKTYSKQRKDNLKIYNKF